MDHKKENVLTKLMIVDDNKPFIEGLSFLLSGKEEYHIIAVASNGKQAIELFKKELPDLVLMDIEMPELNGIEATKRILWQNPSIKFIAITMYNDKAYLTELLGAGFKGCIFKNEVSSKLDAAIETVMKGKLFFPKGIKI